MVFAAIATTWIVIPAYHTTASFLTTDIVGETCVPYGDYSRMSLQAILISEFLHAYLLPLVTMLVCYSRIVYALTHKVTSNYHTVITVQYCIQMYTVSEKRSITLIAVSGNSVKT